MMKKSINNLLVTCIVIMKLNYYIKASKKKSVNSYNGQTKNMNFLTADDDLLEKYNTIWDKVRY